MSTALQALDRRLDALRSAQDTRTTSLHALEANGTYTLLAVNQGLAGATAGRAGPALAAVDEVRHGLQMLDELLDWVTSLRTSARMSDSRADRLVQLLDGPCIVYGADTAAHPAATHPAATRPAAPAPKVTPDALFTAIDHAFTAVGTVVAEVDTAWRDFRPRLVRVTGEADRLVGETPDLLSPAAARAALVDLSHRAADDPLGAADELRRIEAAVAAAVNAQAESSRRLYDALATAAGTVGELETLVAEGRDALARSWAEIAEPRGLLDAVDPAVLDGERGLRPWLRRLERLVADGQATLAATGLESWWGLAEPALATARAVAAANALPIRRRQELRGLLGAARAKAETAGRAEDLRVAELAARADRALVVPCDLEVAEARVHDYLDELRRSPAPAPDPAVRGWTEVSA